MGLYRHIGVASTFSPRFYAVLAEADRYARCFESPLSIIHAAAEHAEAAERFFKVLEKLQRNDDTGVIWSVGSTPTEAILSACVQGKVDLLLAGALEREGDHRNFVGGVARELLQQAPCDLLLLPKPKEEAIPCKRVAVEVDLKEPCIQFLNRACQVARHLNAAEMIFIGIVTPFDQARSEDTPLDEMRLAGIIDQASGFDGDIDFQLLRSTTGFGVCDFLQENNIEFFIANFHYQDGLRYLPTRLDWLRQVIPTNVLLLCMDH